MVMYQHLEKKMIVPIHGYWQHKLDILKSGENKVQTNISLEQKLILLLKDCVLKVVLVSTLTTQTKLAVKKCLKHGAQNVFEILMGKLRFKEQRTEEKNDSKLYFNR